MKIYFYKNMSTVSSTREITGVFVDIRNSCYGIGLLKKIRYDGKRIAIFPFVWFYHGYNKIDYNL